MKNESADLGLDCFRAFGRVEQSADFNGAAQIDIQAKKIFMGHLDKSIKVQSCQKPNKNDMLSMSIYFVSQK